jgi:hypothetical protein
MKLYFVALPPSASFCSTPCYCCGFPPALASLSPFPPLSSLSPAQNFFSVKSTFRSHVSKDQIPAWEGTVLPHALVLEFDEKIIAEQLTLIEFDIYKNIKPRYGEGKGKWKEGEEGGRRGMKGGREQGRTLHLRNLTSITRELLGQAWTKEKQQCISRNVVDLIQRANYVSYWVASSILFQNVWPLPLFLPSLTPPT